jgi:hypothetical protein
MKYFVVALAVCLLGFSNVCVFAQTIIRGIVSRPVLLFLDNTLIEGVNGNNSLTDIDGDGLFEVLPGDLITLPGSSTPFVVPELPGYPNGTPYEYDPSGPAIIGGSPLVTLPVDGSPITEPISFPGYDAVDAEDDIVINVPSDVSIGDGYVSVEEPDADIAHRDGSALEGGPVPVGSVISTPNIIVRPGTGNALPADNIDPTGAIPGGNVPNITIRLVTGNTVDADGDGEAPWTAPGGGIYDPVAQVFYPDSDPGHPYIVPPEPGTSTGLISDPVIESISLDAVSIHLGWPNYLSSEEHLSVIQAKALLTDPTVWEELTNGARGVVITPSNAVIPRILESVHGGGPYKFFKRVVPL